jgi:hypothetical protein
VEVPPRSARSNAEAPVVDFDLNGPFASFDMMGLMCWPDKAKRAVRLAKMGIYLRGEQEPIYLDLVKRALEATADGRPPSGTLEKLTAEVSSDFAMRGFLTDWAKRHSASYAKVVRSYRRSQYQTATMTHPYTGYTFPVHDFGAFSNTAGLVDWEGQFWAWICEPEVRLTLASDPRSVFDPYHDRLIAESGGHRAAARGPSIDVIAAEFQDCLLGYPMLAGLVLILIQIFKDHYSALDENGYPEIVPSLNSACRTIAGLEVIKGKFNEVRRHWPNWCFVAPLWAAFLIEARCLNSESLIDVSALEDAYMNVILTDERRCRLLPLAKPFCELVRTHEARGHPLTPYPERTLRLPVSVSPAVITLPELTGKALKIARPEVQPELKGA